MSWLGLAPWKGKRRPPLPGAAQVVSTQGRAEADTRAAIDELSRAIRNNPEAVEIYLALGNLYRSQGEIERAVQIRDSLISRPGLDPEFKARAWFELGRDFRRGGFLDRALAAFEEARSLSGDTPSILSALAKLAADGGEFQRAAELYESLRLPVAQAHYLVRLAAETQEKDRGLAAKILKQALRIHPGSVEAWLQALILDYRSGRDQAAAATLNEALDSVSPPLSFVLLEGFLQSLAPSAPFGPALGPPSGQGQGSRPLDDPRACELVVSVVGARPPDVLLSYYAAWFLLLTGRKAEARDWLVRSLGMQPEFWPARLELLAMGEVEQEMSPAFKDQLDFFIDKARQVKRFVCGACGLRRETLFYVCPRCLSWHSITFRVKMFG